MKKKRIKDYKLVLLILTILMFVLSPSTDTKDKKVNNTKSEKTYYLNKNDYDKLTNNIGLSQVFEDSDNKKKITIDNQKEIVSEDTNEEVKPEEVINTVEEQTEESKKIAFTFDDGPSVYTKDLLKILKENNAKATFFVLGSRINKYNKIITTMQADGHQIGSHGYSHKAFTKLTNEELIKELKTTKELLEKYNVIPTLVRPPYGSADERIKETVDYPLIVWSVDTRDWEHRDSEKGTHIIIENIDDGSIILMHDIYKSTIETVKQVLPMLKKQGYEFVTISELFEETELEEGKLYYKKTK